MRAVSTDSGIILNTDLDNVATTTRDVEPGESITGVEAVERISRFHKIALRNIEAGHEVYKYGEVIGVAKENIAVGSWVHTHNLRMHDITFPAQKQPELRPPVDQEPLPDRFFLGYPQESAAAATFVPETTSLSRVPWTVRPVSSIWRWKSSIGRRSTMRGGFRM